MSSARALAFAALMTMTGQAKAQEAAPPAPEPESLPPPPTVSEPVTPPPQQLVAAPQPRPVVAPRRWETLPVLRLALGEGGNVPSSGPDQTNDVVLTLHGGVQLIREAFGARGLVLEPEAGYSLRRTPLGDEHMYNMGLGIGYSYRAFFSILYIPYFVAGTGAYLSPAATIDRRPEYGLRHGVLIGLIYSLLTVEFSHQVLAPTAGLPTLQDIRFLVGVDLSRWILGAYALGSARKLYRP